VTPEEAVRRIAQAREALVNEVHKVIIGQEEMIEQMLICTFARGHCLTIGVPGLAKTLMISTLAQAMRLSFKRIQFTPDLMPSDITGSSVYSRETATFSFAPGPIFTHLLLADEINRAPAKTQSALLEAMQDYQVTVDGTSRALPAPFAVVATQNPVESQGTYPLPEAQLDRFLVKLVVADPPADVERKIVRQHADGFDPTDLRRLEAVATPDVIVAMQQYAQAVRVDDAVISYIVDLVRRTREDRAIELGASPRASIPLLKAAQVVAASEERDFVTPDDVKPMVSAVLRHRVMLHADAQLQGVTPDERIAEIVQAVPVPRLAA